MTGDSARVFRRSKPDPAGGRSAACLRWSRPLSRAGPLDSDRESASNAGPGSRTSASARWVVSTDWGSPDGIDGAPSSRSLPPRQHASGALDDPTRPDFGGRVRAGRTAQGLRRVPDALGREEASCFGPRAFERADFNRGPRSGLQRGPPLGTPRNRRRRREDLLPDGCLRASGLGQGPPEVRTRPTKRSFGRLLPRKQTAEPGSHFRFRLRVRVQRGAGVTGLGSGSDASCPRIQYRRTRRTEPPVAVPSPSPARVASAERSRAAGPRGAPRCWTDGPAVARARVDSTPARAPSVLESRPMLSGSPALRAVRSPARGGPGEPPAWTGPNPRSGRHRSDARSPSPGASTCRAGTIGSIGIRATARPILETTGRSTLVAILREIPGRPVRRRMRPAAAAAIGRPAGAERPVSRAGTERRAAVLRCSAFGLTPCPAFGRSAELTGACAGVDRAAAETSEGCAASRGRGSSHVGRLSIRPEVRRDLLPSGDGQRAPAKNRLTGAHQPRDTLRQPVPWSGADEHRPGIGARKAALPGSYLPRQSLHFEAGAPYSFHRRTLGGVRSHIRIRLSPGLGRRPGVLVAGRGTVNPAEDSAHYGPSSNYRVILC